MASVTTDNAYVYGGNMQSRYAVRTSSILNAPFVIWSNGAFNGGFTMDVYITYAYTKVL